MGMREAAASVPSKPIIAVVLSITVAVALWHGWTVREFCTKRAALSGSVQDWAEKAIAGFGAEFKLETATDFDWDQVRISQGVTEPGIGTNCPFGWHWSNAKREEMAEAGELTLIGFIRQGRLVRVADFDRRWAIFDIDGEAISREKATFVNRPGTDSLRLAGPSLGQ